MLDPLDLVAEQRDPVGGLGVGGKDLQELALDPKRPAGEVGVVAPVLHPDQLSEQLVALDPLAHLEQLHLLAVELRRPDSVDARHRGDDHDVAPGEQRRGRRVAEPIDLVVDRRVLLDVEVLRRHVGLGLVVVVVADEVLDRVLAEELAELVAELRRQRLVVGDHQRRPLHPLDHPGHRERLPGARGAEQGQETLVGPQALGEPRDRLRLVGGRRVGGIELEIGHRAKIAGVPTPRGYRGRRIRSQPSPRSSAYVVPVLLALVEDLLDVGAGLREPDPVEVEARRRPTVDVAGAGVVGGERRDLVAAVAVEAGS